MLKPDEFFHIVIAIIVSAFVLSFLQGSEKFLTSLFYSFLIIFAAVFLKKLAAYYFETDIRHKTWHFLRDRKINLRKRICKSFSTSDLYHRNSHAPASG